MDKEWDAMTQDNNCQLLSTWNNKIL